MFTSDGTISVCTATQLCSHLTALSVSALPLSCVHISRHYQCLHCHSAVFTSDGTISVCTATQLCSHLTALSVSALPLSCVHISRHYKCLPYRHHSTTSSLSCVPGHCPAELSVFLGILQPSERKGTHRLAAAFTILRLSPIVLADLFLFCNAYVQNA